MLNVTYLLAAALDPMDGPVLEGQASKLFGYNVRDMIILGGMVLVLAVALFLFAYLTKKNRRATISPAGTRAIYRAEERDDSDQRKYRKKRRRHNHPEFLPRNPTLQETGGLPPLRPEEPAEPTQ
ncbi:MAG TPA: hypothetical protein VJ063_19395 [Verrucomicrobiae bacterium]|nr:hypothetical protein [Verrucomicrobiae bacterium]